MAAHDRAHAERQWREPIDAHRLAGAEFRLRTPGGGWRWINLPAAPEVIGRQEITMTSTGPSYHLVRGVDDVLITAELSTRPSPNPDYQAESRALGLLAQEMATNPRGVLQKCAEMVMELCHAESAGISILEPGGTNEILRWHAAAGALAPNLHGTMPCEASPCGTVMERDRLLLFNEAERFFPDLRDVEPRIYENLLAPWHVKGKAVGTLWAIKHTPEGRFNAEDARVLQSLARFAAAAFQMISALDQATAERSALQTSEGRLRSVLDGMDEAFSLMDRDLRIITQNKAALAIDGRQFEELRGRKHSEVYPDTDPKVIALYERALAESESVSLEHSYGRQGRRASWFEMRAFPVPEGLAVFWRDIFGSQGGRGKAARERAEIPVPIQQRHPRARDQSTCAGRAGPRRRRVLSRSQSCLRGADRLRTCRSDWPFGVRDFPAHWAILAGDGGARC